MASAPSRPACCASKFVPDAQQFREHGLDPIPTGVRRE
jgi:hypothetical protein